MVSARISRDSAMAVQLDAIRSTAERVAISHSLDVVDLEFQGGVKFRTLRIYIEKNAAERAKLAALAESGTAEDLPKGVPAELLSGVTHEDCAKFAQDFGTVLDVEDLIPGAEYTLEVSSPGSRTEAKQGRGLPTLHRQHRKATNLYAGQQQPALARPLDSFTDGILTLDLSAVKQKGKAKKAVTASDRRDCFAERRESASGSRDLSSNPKLNSRNIRRK